MVKNPPVNAGDTGLIPHAAEHVQEDPTCHGATKTVGHNY